MHSHRVENKNKEHRDFFGKLPSKVERGATVSQRLYVDTSFKGRERGDGNERGIKQFMNETTLNLMWTW